MESEWPLIRMCGVAGACKARPKDLRDAWIVNRGTFCEGR